MKILFILLLTGFWWLATVAQSNKIKTPKVAANKGLQVVEAACGQCKLGLPGKSCDLAVRIDGQSYFVDGTTIDSHGDAHADNGFCQAIRKAEVRGEIIDKRFKASYFKLLSDTSKKQQVN